MYSCKFSRDPNRRTSKGALLIELFSNSNMGDEFYVRYYVGHKGKFGHEFLEFEFRPDGKQLVQPPRTFRSRQLHT